MNERIQKLAKEANCNIDGMGYGEGNLEQFAELIIRECADTAENCFVYWPMDGSLQRKGCANAIKKHFGVE